MKTEIFKKPLPYLALFVAHLIWGANFVVAKITLEEIPTMSLGFLRFGLACLLMIPFLATFEGNDKKIKVSHLPMLIFGGLLIVTFNIALFYEGLMRTTAINASVISLSVPIFSVLAGWMFLKEKLYVVNFLGIIFGLLGALVILGLPVILSSNFSAVSFMGNMLILLCSLSFVWGSIIFKKMFKYYPPIIITSFVFLVGAVSFLVPAVLEYIKDPTWTSQISILGVLGLLYITILSSVSAYFLMTWGLSKVDLNKASLIQYIEPAIAATLAIPLLGERISYSFIIGTCLVVLGVYWGTMGKSHHHIHHHRHHRS